MANHSFVTKHNVVHVNVNRKEVVVRNDRVDGHTNYSIKQIGAISFANISLAALRWILRILGVILFISGVVLIIVGGVNKQALLLIPGFCNLAIGAVLFIISFFIKDYSLLSMQTKAGKPIFSITGHLSHDEVDMMTNEIRDFELKQ